MIHREADAVHRKDMESPDVAGAGKVQGRLPAFSISSRMSPRPTKTGGGAPSVRPVKSSSPSASKDIESSPPSVRELQYHGKRLDGNRKPGTHCGRCAGRVLDHLPGMVRPLPGPDAERRPEPVLHPRQGRRSSGALRRPFGRAMPLGHPVPVGRTLRKARRHGPLPRQEAARARPPRLMPDRCDRLRGAGNNPRKTRTCP